jgi:hypothetical protein
MGNNKVGAKGAKVTDYLNAFEVVVTVKRMHCYLQPELNLRARPAVCWTVQSLQDNVVRTAGLPFPRPSYISSLAVVHEECQIYSWPLLAFSLHCLFTDY